MRDIPIIFSAPMIRALLEGRKLMTRRLSTVERKVKQTATTPEYWGGFPSSWTKVEPGDRLWVRESVRAEEDEETGVDFVRYLADNARIDIAADKLAAERWVDLNHYRMKRGLIVPPIHSPRWTSRLTLIVTAVKMEPLQKISGIDAVAEGIELDFPGGHHGAYGRAKHKFKELWLSLHGPLSWDANPEVVAISFKVVKQNIDAIRSAA